jgi:hypothetical protein
MTSTSAAIFPPSLFHLYTEITRPSIVTVPLYNIAGLLVPNDSLPQFVNIDNSVAVDIEIG